MCVELSTDGTTWTDFSDWITVLEPPEITRMSGEAYVYGEDVPVITGSKRQPVEVPIRGVYEDATATSDPFVYLWNVMTTSCGGRCHIRWAPAGCTTTSQVFSTATGTADVYGELIGLTPPSGPADDGSPLLWAATIKAPQLYKATYA
jgi:hypothetical protein